MPVEGFALAARRQRGQWRCELVPHHAMADVAGCLAAVRPYADCGASIALVTAEQFFVALRVDRAGEPRYLLCDATAAFDWPLARQVLLRVTTDPTVSPAHIWPAGELGLFADLGVDEAELRLLLDNVELYADELLGYLSECLGFGPEYAAVVDGRPGTLTA